jgi:hypothetical protein
MLTARNTVPHADWNRRNTFLAGTVQFVCIAQIPQRFVTVNNVSPLSAAIRLLTFGAFIPIGSTLAGALMGKGKLPPCYVVLAGAILEIIGVVLLSRIDTSIHVDNAQYGYQVIAGLGTGMINAALILLIPYIMEKRDLGKHPTPQFVNEFANTPQPLDQPQAHNSAFSAA